MVSVIIPTYNRCKYICQSIDSVLDQTYQDFEIILIDDGSTDETKQIVTRRYKNENRLKYIYQKNQERSAARNRGIVESSGEYLAFLDSDDLWLSSKLEKQVEVLDESNETDMVVTWWDMFDDDFNKILDVSYPDIADIDSGIFGPLMAYSNRVGSPTPLIRKSALVGRKLFSENLNMGEDWEFWTRVAIRGKVALVPEILARHRIHKNNSEIPVDLSVYLKVIKTLKADLSKSEWNSCKKLVMQRVDSYISNKHKNQLLAKISMLKYQLLI